MKKYQVFISSTVEDLKDERQAVIKCVLKLRHIPVAMEHFVAGNEEQFSYIKKLLDDTDYYIVIIGNRYGSQADDGISYTEKEFDYAVSLGIPVIACVHKDPDSLPVNKSDKKKSSIAKLDAFREKIMHNRLVSYINWTTPESLSSEIVIALVNEINDYPRKGWERVDLYDNSQLLTQINHLRIENDKLKAELNSIKESKNAEKEILSFPWEEVKHILGSSAKDAYSGITIDINLTWRQYFSIIGRALLTFQTYSAVRRIVNDTLFPDEKSLFAVKDVDFQGVLCEFGKLRLIDFNGDNIYLTQTGKDYLYTTASVGADELINIHQTIEQIEQDHSHNVVDNTLESIINDLSDFNSNPESINYLGKTLIQLKKYLADNKTWESSGVDEAQRIIQDILADAFQSDRVDEGIFDPMFDLAKVGWLIDYLHKNMKKG